jgi:hypothetical protein
MAVLVERVSGGYGSAVAPDPIRGRAAGSGGRRTGMDHTRERGGDDEPSACEPAAGANAALPAGPVFPYRGSGDPVCRWIHGTAHHSDLLADRSSGGRGVRYRLPDHRGGNRSRDKAGEKTMRSRKTGSRKTGSRKTGSRRTGRRRTGRRKTGIAGAIRAAHRPGAAACARGWGGGVRSCPPVHGRGRHAAG